MKTLATLHIQMTQAHIFPKKEKKKRPFFPKAKCYTWLHNEIAYIKILFLSILCFVTILLSIDGIRLQNKQMSKVHKAVQMSPVDQNPCQD